MQGIVGERRRPDCPGPISQASLASVGPSINGTKATGR